MTMYACTDSVTLTGAKFTIDYEYEMDKYGDDEWVHLILHKVTIDGSDVDLLPYLSGVAWASIRNLLVEDIKEAAR